MNVSKFCEYGVPNYPCKIKNKIEFIRFGQSIFWGKEYYEINGPIKKNVKCIVRLTLCTCITGTCAKVFLPYIQFELLAENLVQDLELTLHAALYVSFSVCIIPVTGCCGALHLYSQDPCWYHLRLLDDFHQVTEGTRH